jgi:hypothetical protein
MTMAVVARGPLVALQQFPAGSVVFVGAIGRRDQRAGVDDQHLIAAEPLGQHLIGLGRATTGRRGADSGEGQPAARRLGQTSCQESRCQLIRGLAATGCLGGQRLRDGIIQVQRYCHDSSVTARALRPVA